MPHFLDKVAHFAETTDVAHLADNAFKHARAEVIGQ